MVRTLPAVSALRNAYPQAELCWLVEPGPASLLRAQPWIDDVLVFPRPDLSADLRALRWGSLRRRFADFRADLRTRRFDMVVDFHSILKSGVLSALSGAPVRVGYARPYGRELAWMFANARARLEPPRATRFERNQALLRYLALEPEVDAQPLRVDPDALARMQAALGAAPAPVVIHPGTSPNTPHKRYGIDAYAKVAMALAECQDGAVLVTRGPDPAEQKLALAVVEASGGAAQLAPDTGSLLDLAALFSLSRLYVGSDTGPMHIASLSGTPVVQIMGPTDPVENTPYPGTPSRTVRVPVACSPCRRGCAAATCMRVIPPDAVISAARELLQGSPALEVRRAGGRLDS